MKLCLGLVLLLCISQVFATDCDSVPTQNPFNITTFQGVWYEIARYSNSPEGDAYCATSKFTLTSDAQHFIVVNSERKGSPSGQLVTGSGAGIIPDPANNPAKFRVQSGGHTISFWILESDYNTYALAFACGKVSIVHYEYGWILSRTPTLDESVKQNLLAKWKNNFHLDAGKFAWSPQQGCTYGQ